MKIKIEVKSNAIFTLGQDYYHDWFPLTTGFLLLSQLKCEEMNKLNCDYVQFQIMGQILMLPTVPWNLNLQGQNGDCDSGITESTN